MKGLKKIVALVILISLIVEQTSVFGVEHGFPSAKEQQEIVLYLRNNFQYALTDPKANEALLALIKEKYPGDTLDLPATVLAYYGALLGLRAKHAFLPNRKLKYLVQSLRLMDEAVKKDDAELETYFLRFSSLQQMPALLSIPKKRKEDIAQIIALLKKNDLNNADFAFRRTIIEFMLQSRRLNQEQIKELESLSKVFRDVK